jgi:predicted flavoprotein YhiN
VDASLLIIGAGPAGLMAALAAARRHLPSGVLVVDRMPAAGAKLAVTGGGRGNLSHVATKPEFAAVRPHGRFTIPAFRSLPPETLRSLADMGVPTTVDASGRIYPRSQSAAQVRDALFAPALRAGVRFVVRPTRGSPPPPAHPGVDRR